MSLSLSHSLQVQLQGQSNCKICSPPLLTRLMFMLTAQLWPHSPIWITGYNLVLEIFYCHLHISFWYCTVNNFKTWWQKTKSNWINFKDLAGFIQRFRNQAASILADRSSGEWYKMEGFYRQKSPKGSSTRQKRWLVMARSHSFRGWQGSIRQMTYLVLIRRILIYWFNIRLLGKPKL